MAIPIQHIGRAASSIKELDDLVSSQEKINDLNFLSRLLFQIGRHDLPVASLPQTLPNIEIWTFGASAFADVNLRYFQNLKPLDQLPEHLLQMGRQIQSFFDNTVGSQDFQKAEALWLQNRYHDLADSVQGLTDHVRKRGDAVALPEHAGGGITSSGGDGRNRPKKTPPDLRGLIPEVWFAAQALGYGHLEMFYDWGPVDSGVSYPNGRISSFGFTAKRIKVIISVVFRYTNSTVVPVLRRERTSINFANVAYWLHVPGPDQWLWDSGAGEGVTGPSVEEPMYVKFALNSVPSGDQEPIVKARSEIEDQISEELVAAVSDSLPNYDQSNHKFATPVLSGDNPIQNDQGEIRKKWIELIQTYKLIETLNLVASYYVRGYKEGCNYGLQAADPLPIVETFRQANKAATGPNLVPLFKSVIDEAIRVVLGRINGSDTSLCYIEHPVVDSIAQVNSKLSILAMFGKQVNVAASELKQTTGSK